MTLDINLRKQGLLRQVIVLDRFISHTYEWEKGLDSLVVCMTVMSDSGCNLVSTLFKINLTIQGSNSSMTVPFLLFFLIWLGLLLCRSGE